MSAPEYPIATIHEMALIPEEALPRFMAELPAILAHVRRLSATRSALADMSDGTLEMVFGDGSWVDDGAGLATVTVDSILWDETLVVKCPLDGRP